jgi:hypothetical protein
MNKMLINSIAVLLSPTGDLVNKLWQTVYGVIKDIGTPLATATLVCSSFYFFIVGKDKNSLDKAKGLMIGSIVGLLIIYLAPTIISAVVDAINSLS